MVMRILSQSALNLLLAALDEQLQAQSPHQAEMRRCLLLGSAIGLPRRKGHLSQSLRSYVSAAHSVDSVVRNQGHVFWERACPIKPVKT